MSIYVVSLSLLSLKVISSYNLPVFSPPPSPSQAWRRNAPTTTLLAVKIRRATSSDGSGTGTIILGKYQRLALLLGRGSFAKVYHGRCLDDNTSIAIKVIDKKSTIADASMEPRILREISAMCRLNHPNIIKLNEEL
ncbi:CBL-interacting serine/threonine-protein kinase 4 [Datura stramonium]|uniref:CBL-interacting serine/threonine-protein kinase 4 n=1 Tax=Datura stramonium TaxID=4076 RepID=A0ABS8VM20_DATST|nr:CBL-interacting serine/threonine-protein kinase 4 [Datura stramonium]